MNFFSRLFNKISAWRKECLGSGDEDKLRNIAEKIVSEQYNRMMRFEYEVQQVDISKVDVCSFGRMIGSFGKYGYCMTNPICLNDFSYDGIGKYLRTIMFQNNGVCRYEVVKMLDVSNIVGSAVKEVAVEFDGIEGKKSFFFAEDKKVSGTDLPEDISPIWQRDIKIEPRITPRLCERVALIRYENSIKKSFTYKIFWKR